MRAACAAHAPQERAPSSRLRIVTDMSAQTSTSYDAIVVGSGITGGWAKELSELGLARWCWRRAVPSSPRATTQSIGQRGKCRSGGWAIGARWTRVSRSSGDP